MRLANEKRDNLNLHQRGLPLSESTRSSGQEDEIMQETAYRSTQQEAQGRIPLWILDASKLDGYVRASPAPLRCLWEAKAQVAHRLIYLPPFWEERLPGVLGSLHWLRVESENEAPEVDAAFLLFPLQCKASSKEIVLQPQPSQHLNVDKLRAHQHLSMCLGAPWTSKDRRHRPPSFHQSKFLKEL